MLGANLVSTQAFAQQTSAPTEATLPVEQTPSPAERERARRLGSLRAACRDARRPDWFGIAAVPVFAASGVALAAWSFTTPATQRTNATVFFGALGPGLVLGAIGVPFGRGWIGAIDPLRNACSTLLERDGTESELLAAEGFMRAFGQPASPVLPIIVGSATALVGGGIALAFAIDNRDLVQAMGGIAAFVVAGWALVPPTPNLVAARGFVSGRYTPAPHVALAFTGNGLAAAGAF
ncbi:MAG: hypothetical protein JNK05_00910 [Myxococcales bacterium]|nr:hypothetical protein [Myxococcales bacterium]